MESLNLNTLASSLPNAQQNAEKELLNDFKAAALSITTLYRSSRKNSKRAYNAGYAAACQDMLNFIQQGLSAGDLGQLGSHEVEGGGMTIGRVMDWTEARVEAIKAREEEEDEDEERERSDKDRERSATTQQPVAGPSVAAKAVERKPVQPLRPKDNTSSLPTPSSPVSHPSTQGPSEPSSPSPPPAGGAPRATAHRSAKPRPPPPSRESFQLTSQSANVSPAPFLTDTFSSSTPSLPFPEAPIVIGAGAKRRHAMMMMLDSSSPISIGGGPSSVASSPGGTANNTGSGYSSSTGSNLGKRRTRSSRNLTQIQSQNQNINSLIHAASESMDVEEDGRERKRVARR